MMHFSFSKSFYFLFYTFMIFMFLNFNSLIILWVLMEINMVLFIIGMSLMYEDSNKSNLEQSFYYLIIQSLASLIFLFGLFHSGSIEFLNIGDSSMFVLLSLLFKLGVFPFQFWMFKISKDLTKINFFLILVIQKLPIIPVIMNFNSNLLIIIFLMNLTLGSIYIFFSKNLVNILVSSSIYSMIWFFIFFLMSPLMLMYFFLNYSVFVWYMIKFFHNLFMGGISSFGKILVNMSMMFLVGLPPLGLFFLKVFSLKFFVDSFSTDLLIFSWLFFFISVIGYFKFFYHLMNLNSGLYKYSLSKSIKSLFFFLSFGFFFSF